MASRCGLGISLRKAEMMARDSIARTTLTTMPASGSLCGLSTSVWTFCTASDGRAIAVLCRVERAADGGTTEPRKLSSRHAGHVGLDESQEIGDDPVLLEEEICPFLPVACSESSMDAAIGLRK